MALPPSTPAVSSPRRLSTSFLSGAISTSASPLRASFNLSCRSPFSPTFPLGPDPSRKGHNTHPKAPPPRPLDAKAFSSKNNPSWRTREVGGQEQSPLSPDSPTDETWFLHPSTPGAAYGGAGHDEGKLGVLSAINIIVGKTVGVGAYLVPSAIFAEVGSVGMALSLWVIGSLISFCGLAVYLELGTAMPWSGGERVYLERLFKKPYMLATCMFMSYTVLLGFSTPNAIVLGEYALYALELQRNSWNVKAIAVVAVSVLCYIHAKHPKFGLRMVNILGFAKILILAIVILGGVVAAFAGLDADRQMVMSETEDGISRVGCVSIAQQNFTNIWAGSSVQPYDYATALLKVIYCFRGYNTANQVLSDVKNPVRTLRIAAPVALALVSVAYLAVNIAFFLVVSKEDMRAAGVAVAGVFFRNVFGDGVGAHVLPFFVLVSAAGNIAATSFAQARVNEELAKDGLLPWSRFWTSQPSSSINPAAIELPAQQPSSPIYLSKLSARQIPLSSPTTPPLPITNPSRGLLLHWLVSAIAIILPPGGRVYAFLVDVGGYPVSAAGAAVSVGLILLRLRSRGKPSWLPPFRAPAVAMVVSAASNALLLLLPWIPPMGGDDQAHGQDGKFVWFAYPVTALAVLGAGAAWWVWWSQWGNGRKGRRAYGRLGSV